MKLLTVLNGYVLLKPRAEEKPKTTSGIEIEIPESVDKERPTVGEVITGNSVFMSSDRTRVAPQIHLSPGEFVLFNAFAPRKVQHEGEDCLLVNGEDIYAVIKV